MNTVMKMGKDNFLMATLVATGLAMVTVGPVMNSPESLAAAHSAGRLVQSVSTPTAMEPILYREPAIVVTAPRIHVAA